MYYLNILCEISKLPFEISHKSLKPYTAKYVFCEVLNFTNCDIFNVMTSEVIVRWDPGQLLTLNSSKLWI